MKVTESLSWGPQKEVGTVSSKTHRGCLLLLSLIFILLPVCLGQFSKVVEKSRNEFSLG